MREEAARKANRIQQNAFPNPHPPLSSSSSSSLPILNFICFFFSFPLVSFFLSIPLPFLPYVSSFPFPFHFHPFQPLPCPPSSLLRILISARPVVFLAFSLPFIKSHLRTTFPCTFLCSPIPISLQFTLSLVLLPLSHLFQFPSRSFSLQFCLLVPIPIPTQLPLPFPLPCSSPISFHSLFLIPISLPFSLFPIPTSLHFSPYFPFPFHCIFLPTSHSHFLAFFPLCFHSHSLARLPPLYSPFSFPFPLPRTSSPLFPVPIPIPSRANTHHVTGGRRASTKEPDETYLKKVSVAR